MNESKGSCGDGVTKIIFGNACRLCCLMETCLSTSERTLDTTRSWCRHWLVLPAACLPSSRSQQFCAASGPPSSVFLGYSLKQSRGEHHGHTAVRTLFGTRRIRLATLTTVRDLKRGEHISVSTVSLGDRTAENCVCKIAVIKIDAEGSEVAILQGAQDLLDRAKPAAIAEANSVLLREGRTSSQELVQTLHTRGYELF